MKTPVLRLIPAVIATCALLSVQTTSAEGLSQKMTAAQVQNSNDELMKRSLKDADELMKLFSEREFSKAAAKMKSDRGMGVLEHAARKKDWKGITKHMHVTSNAKEGEIWHMYAYDSGHGTDMYLWIVFKHDEGGLGKPTLFAGGC